MILGLVALNVATASIQAVLPLSVAPAVNIILGESKNAADSVSHITLDNIGPTLTMHFGIDPNDFLSIIVLVSSLYIVLTISLAGLKTIAMFLSAHISGRTLHDLIKALHLQILSLPLSFFNKNKDGDIISRFTTDTSATVNLLDSLVRGLFQSMLQSILMFFLLIQTDALLAFSLIAVGCGHLLITRLLSNWIRKRTKAVYDFYGRMTAALQESLQNIRVTKSFAAEDFDHRRLVDEVISVRDNLFRFRMARYVEEPVRLIADALSVCGILLLSYYAMESGRVTKSGFGMFVLLASRTVAPLSEFSKNFLNIFTVAGSADRILEMFAIQNSKQAGKELVAPFTSTLSFEKVCFSYGSERRVLKDIDLEIKRGQMIALVGPSGGGKSTLCDLLLRLYEPSSGRILYDGVDITTFSGSSYLNRFGVVPQESLLLNASVKENILYGRELDTEKFAHAIRVANASDFIDALPEKEETFIGDRGVRLSGGQRQRLGIARAVYNQPEILVLDEATSALDTESERVVQEAIDNAIRSMTAIVIAHRLSTVRHADCIVVIDNGVVEASGTHEELLEASVVYRRLHEMQFAKMTC